MKYLEDRAKDFKEEIVRAVYHFERAQGDLVSKWNNQLCSKTLWTNKIQSLKRQPSVSLSKVALLSSARIHSVTKTINMMRNQNVRVW